MTFSRLDAIVAHWQRVPPLSVSVARVSAFLGVPVVKPPPVKDKPKELEPAKMQELFDMLGMQGVSNEKPSWLKAAAATT